MISLVMNRIIPSTGLLVPPCVSCGMEASGLCSTGCRAFWSVVIVVARSVRGRAAVAKVEQRSLRADLREPVEVVGRWRRGRRPLERVGLPWVVARRRAAAQREEDVPQEEQHARRDREP